MAPVMSKPVMLPQSQTHRPDPHRPALRSDGLVINTLHCSEFSHFLKIKTIGSLKGSSNIQTQHAISRLKNYSSPHLRLLMSFPDSPAVSQSVVFIL